MHSLCTLYPHTPVDKLLGTEFLQMDEIRDAG